MGGGLTILDEDEDEVEDDVVVEERDEMDGLRLDAAGSDAEDGGELGLGKCWCYCED